MTTTGVTWRKSSFSGDGGAGGGNCVEARSGVDGYALRDSKAPESGTLVIPRTGMTALLTAITA